MAAESFLVSSCPELLVTAACSGVLLVATVRSFAGYAEAAIPTEKVLASSSARDLCSPFGASVKAGF